MTILKSIPTQIYEKSKHLIGVDSLEVQIRRSPFLTPKTKRKELKINYNECHIKLEPKSQFIDKCELNIKNTSINKPTESNSNILIDKTISSIRNTDYSRDFKNINSQFSETVTTVIIENTKTPTRSHNNNNNLIRNLLEGSKFDPDSIDGHHLESNINQLHHQFVENDNSDFTICENLDEQLDSHNVGNNIGVDQMDGMCAKSEDSVNENYDDISLGSNSNENNISLTGILVDKPMNITHLENYEKIYTDNGSLKVNVQKEELEGVDTKFAEIHTSSTSTTDQNGNFVKFKAKRFLQKKLSMKENEILQVLREVKENNRKERKEKKTSYDLSTPESSSGVSSCHSLLKNSAPGRENWRLRESDSSKSSSTRK